MCNLNSSISFHDFCFVSENDIFFVFVSGDVTPFGGSQNLPAGSEGVKRNARSKCDTGGSTSSCTACRTPSTQTAGNAALGEGASSRAPRASAASRCKSHKSRTGTSAGGSSCDGTRPCRCDTPCDTPNKGTLSTGRCLQQEHTTTTM